MSIAEIASTTSAVVTCLALGGAYFFRLSPKIDEHDKTLKSHSDQHTKHFDREDEFSKNMASVTATLKERDRYYEQGREELGRRIDRLETQSNGKKVA